MTGFSEFDRAAMQRALALATRGSTSTQPNPRVGCVLGREGRWVGEGWHQRAGAPHAEAMALQQAGVSARGATAYVTLEPCDHTGRTPPCTAALLAAGVSRVVYAIADPDPRVAGRGAARLQSSGIQVEAGLLSEAAEAVNCGYLSRLRRGRPWVRLKLAASLDGRTALANGRSQWLTGSEARADVQRWRAESAAILTGIGTVLADDPALTVRIGPEPRRQPDIVVVDSDLRLPASARLLQSAGGVHVFHASDNETVAAALRECGARLERLPPAAHADGSDPQVDLTAMLARLGALQVNEVWTECGATLAGSLLREQLVDELVLYLAPRLLGSDAAPLVQLTGLTALSEQPPWQVHDLQRVGGDVRIMLRPARSA